MRTRTRCPGMKVQLVTRGEFLRKGGGVIIKGGVLRAKKKGANEKKMPGRNFTERGWCIGGGSPSINFSSIERRLQVARKSGG